MPTVKGEEMIMLRSAKKEIEAFIVLKFLPSSSSL